MNMVDSNPTPVTDEHIEFAHALVALARKHEADNLDVSFRLTGGRRFFEHRDDYQNVKFQWHEGRHGERSRFLLKAEATVSVEERKSEL